MVIIRVNNKSVNVPEAIRDNVPAIVKHARNMYRRSAAVRSVYVSIVSGMSKAESPSGTPAVTHDMFYRRKGGDRSSWIG